MRDSGDSAQAGRTGLWVLCALLLLGDLGWSLRERAVQELFKSRLLQFSQDAILLNFLIGALPALIALSLGPLIGAWSDRSGKRIPFLLGTVCLTVLAMLGLAASASLLALAACWTLFEIAAIVGNPLFVALINDTVPRPVLGRFFAAYRIVSLATGAGFFALYFGNDLALMYRPLLLAITAIYLLCMLAVCWRVREPARAAASLPRQRLFNQADAQWTRLFLALALAAVAVLPVNINALNASAQFGVDPAAFGNAYALTYVVSILLAWPLGWLADRYHPLRVGGVVLVLYVLSMLLAWQLVAGRTSFLVALVAHGVLAGCFLTGTASLLPAMLPRERFSQLAAICASVTAMLTVVATVALGAWLDANGRDFRLLYLAGAMFASLGAIIWGQALRRGV